MLGDSTLFERQLKDFQEIENDPNRNVDEQEELTSRVECKGCGEMFDATGEEEYCSPECEERDTKESKTDEQEEVVEEARTKEDIEQEIKDIKKKMADFATDNPDFDDKVDKYDREVEKLEAELKDLEEKCKKVKEGDEEVKQQDESKVNEATVGCPNCGGELDVVEDDVRDEWERIDYYCPKCKRDFSRKIEFDQAGMTTSDEWDDEEGTPVDETKTDEQEEVNEVFKTEEDVAKFVEKNAKVTGKYDERVSVNYGDKSYQSEDTHDLVVQICKDKNIACESKTNEEEIEGENKVDTVSNDPSFERAVEKFAQIESDENKNAVEDVQVEEDLYDEPEFPATKDEKPEPSPAVSKAMDEEDDTNVIVDRLKEWIGLEIPDDSIAAVVWALAREPELLDMISRLPTAPEGEEESVEVDPSVEYKDPGEYRESKTNEEEVKEPVESKEGVEEQKSTLMKASDAELKQAMTDLNKHQYLSSAVTTAMDAIADEIGRREQEKDEKEDD